MSARSGAWRSWRNCHVPCPRCCSGTSLIEALQTTAGALPRVGQREGLLAASVKVSSGERLAAALRGARLFPDAALRMVEVEILGVACRDARRGGRLSGRTARRASGPRFSAHQAAADVAHGADRRLRDHRHVPTVFIWRTLSMGHPFKQADLATILVARGYVAPAALEALAAANDRGLAERLRADDVVSPEQLLVALAELIGLPYRPRRIRRFARAFRLPAGAEGIPARCRPVSSGRRAGDRNRHRRSARPAPVRTSRTPDRSHGALPSRAEAIKARSSVRRGAGAVLKNISEDFRLLVVQETEEGDERTIRSRT